MEYLKPIYSRSKSEAEIQADLYGSLKTTGLEPRLEVRGYIPDASMPKKRKKCRFDIVVFWPLNHRCICIIECKKGKGVSKNSSQIARYSKFGVPVIVCGRNGHDTVIHEVMQAAFKDADNCPPSLAPQWRKSC